MLRAQRTQHVRLDQVVERQKQRLFAGRLDQWVELWRARRPLG